jgi:hypothetical protein
MMLASVLGAALLGQVGAGHTPPAPPAPAPEAPPSPLGDTVVGRYRVAGDEQVPHGYGRMWVLEPLDPGRYGTIKVGSLLMPGSPSVRAGAVVTITIAPASPPGDTAPASAPAVYQLADARGQVWTSPDPGHLARWVASRNAAAMPVTYPLAPIWYAAPPWCVGGRCR